LERIDSFAGTAAFETWLISIAVNHCRDRLRRRKVRQVLSLSGLRLSSSRRDPAAMLEERLFQDALWQMVNQLDDRLRLPFILRYRYDYSCGEAADILGLAVNTIYEQLSRARRQLRQMAEETMQSENQSNLLFKKL
jgi:RNA polymerase sigma-70 factor (ECF subfamily)